jgi:uracil DNA glycosylase
MALLFNNFTMQKSQIDKSWDKILNKEFSQDYYKKIKEKIVEDINN